MPRIIRLQQRFGPEYDRVVGERDSRRTAEAELTEREHAGTLDHYRAAEEISQRAAAGTASTEDLRATTRYRCFYDPGGRPPALLRSSAF